MARHRKGAVKVPVLTLAVALCVAGCAQGPSRLAGPPHPTSAASGPSPLPSPRYPNLALRQQLAAGRDAAEYALTVDVRPLRTAAVPPFAPRPAFADDADRGGAPR